MQEKDLCEEYIGKFPVIFVSLKSVDGLDFKMASDALKTVIGKESKRFRFLRESPYLDEKDKTAYERLINVDRKIDSSYAMSDATLIDSLYFAVLTGCLRISKESIFTGLNNPKVHTISDIRYNEFFGSTTTDVDELLEFYGLSSYKGMICEWYDGYRFGDTDMYCPWDVINYCDELLADPGAEPENYWVNTSGNDLVRRLLKKANQTTRNDVEYLINGETITKTIRQDQPFLHGISDRGCGHDSGYASRLPVEIHQRERYGSSKEHEGKLLS